MKPTRIRKHRAPQQQQSDSYQTSSVPRRRSSRLQSRRGPVSILHSLKTYKKPQRLTEQVSIDPETLLPVGAIYTPHLPTSVPIEVSASKPSREQFQEYPCVPQTHNHQTRRRDESIETNIETPPKHCRVTKKNLKMLERMAGNARDDPKSKSSRIEPNPYHSEATSTPPRISESSGKTVSTSDSRFQHLAFKNGVLNPINSTPPENLDYLQGRLNSPRETESPTEAEYQDFVYRTQEAPNVQTMVRETSKLLKEYGRGYRQVNNQALNEFPKSVGFNTGLSVPQPDMIAGLDLREFEPFPVREELGGAAVPTWEINSTTLPHLAGEWKARGKNMIQAETQAAYDGASMVYGRNKARSFLENPDPTGYAYVQTFTTDGTILNTFAHYSSESQDKVKYHQYPTSISLLASSYEDFKQSRRRLRNLQDDAKKTSEQLRDELKEQWLANH